MELGIMCWFKTRFTTHATLTERPIRIPAAQLPTEIPANGLGKAARVVPSTWLLILM